MADFFSVIARLTLSKLIRMATRLSLESQKSSLRQYRTLQHQRRQKETNREDQLFAELYHSWKLMRALVGLNLVFTDTDRDVDWLYVSFLTLQVEVSLSTSP